MGELLLVNPRKRRKKKRAAKRKHNPIKAHRRSRGRKVARVTRIRRRRNPISGGLVNSTLKPALIGGVGSVGLDVLLTKLPIPESLKGGAIGTLTKAAIAVGAGMVAEKVVKRATAQQMVVGALTVILAGGLRSVAATAVPSLGLSGVIDNDLNAIGFIGDADEASDGYGVNELPEMDVVGGVYEDGGSLDMGY